MHLLTHHGGHRLEALLPLVFGQATNFIIFGQQGGILQQYKPIIVYTTNCIHVWGYFLRRRKGKCEIATWRPAPGNLKSQRRYMRWGECPTTFIHFECRCIQSIYVIVIFICCSIWGMVSPPLSSLCAWNLRILILWEIFFFLGGVLRHTKRLVCFKVWESWGVTLCPISGMTWSLYIALCEGISTEDCEYSFHPRHCRSKRLNRRTRCSDLFYHARWLRSVDLHCSQSRKCLLLFLERIIWW